MFASDIFLEEVFIWSFKSEYFMRMRNYGHQDRSLNALLCIQLYRIITIKATATGSVYFVDWRTTALTSDLVILGARRQHELQKVL